MKKVSITAQIAEVEYELKMRRGVYPRMVGSGRLRGSEAEYHIRHMEAVLATLNFMRDHEADIRAFIAARRKDAP